MNKPSDLSIEDGLELSLDTLDQWEQELDDFATNILSRIGKVSGKNQPSTSESSEPSVPNTSQPSE